MRIALAHNLRLSNAVEDAEFDTPETIDALGRALSRAGHNVERVDVSGPPSRLVARLEAYSPDVIFNIAEGRRGRVRRGFYAALFEELSMPATGSDAYTLCVTLDKALTKKVLAGAGVPSPRGRLVTRASLRTGGLDDLVYPVIAKPNYEGSSKGISQSSVAEDPIDLGRTVDELLDVYPDGVLLERFVPGVDVRVYKVDGLAQGTILPPVELRVDSSIPRRFAIYDFGLATMQQGVSFERAQLAPRVQGRIADLSERIFSALGIRDFGYLDFRVASDGEVFFLSATPLPSLEPLGSFAKAADLHGLDYDAAVLAILRAACARTGLLAQLEQAKPRPRSGRRTQLRVGLAYNMKRVASEGGDDREAEYDPPETIEAIARAIESHGHNVALLEANNDFPRALITSGVDLVFNIAEGIRGRNREAQVPSLCELMGVPFTGSDSATLSICLDKGLAKRLLKDVDTPEWQVLVTGREKLRAFKYPVIVKPNAEGTSKGITGKCVVDDENGVRDVAREIIDKYGQPALVEEYVFGREFTVGLLGERRPRILPPMEVAFLSPSERPVYDYECKQDWQKFVRYEVPANVTKEELRAIERACRATFTTLGCRDVARVDLRLTPQGKVYVIEVNPLPGLTPDYSDLCLIANGAGMDYRTLIGEILSGAIKRWREKQDGAEGAPRRVEPRAAEEVRPAEPTEPDAAAN